MKFSEELNNYLNILDCSPKELSYASSLSPTIISRYLNDKRTPRLGSEYFDKIVGGLYKLSTQKNIDLNKNEITDRLTKCITYTDIDYDSFIVNFNTLLVELKISISDIAKAVGYDTSFISKIKNKTRKPADIHKFIDDIGNIVVQNYQDYESKKKLATLFNCSLANLEDDDKYKEYFYKWISSFQENNKESVNKFLTFLDTFDLNDYISTDFNKVKLPTSPIILKSSKTYYGADGRKEAEGEFLKTTLLSKSKDPIYLYSDLPILDAGMDESFKKNSIKAITLVLKKGLHLNIIHNVERPISEMLLGLESWIPIYMTGSISPYYFQIPPSNLFKGSYMASGSCFLAGECLNDNLDVSRFYFTTKKEDVDYYNSKLKYMISKAKPLMVIYKEDDIDKFNDFINKPENLDTIDIQKDIYNNINFTINKGKWIMINKLANPEIHFVIYNSKLRFAIEDFLNN